MTIPNTVKETDEQRLARQKRMRLPEAQQRYERAKAELSSARVNLLACGGRLTDKEPQ
jgi:hypothetical protein